MQLHSLYKGSWPSVRFLCSQCSPAFGAVAGSRQHVAADEPSGTIRALLLFVGARLKIALDSDIDIEPIKQKLERAYARLKSMPSGDDSAEVLQELEQLERELLDRHAAYVEKRDSSLPPKTMS